MMKDIVVQFPRVRKFLQSADDILRIRLSTLMIDGSEEELTLTANAQPALLMHSMALLQLLKEEVGFNVRKDVHLVFGHSVGEFSALCAAESLTFEDSLKITVYFYLLNVVFQPFKKHPPKPRNEKRKKGICSFLPAATSREGHGRNDQREESNDGSTFPSLRRFRGVYYLQTCRRNDKCHC